MKRSYLAAGVAILSGLIVLASYFFNNAALFNMRSFILEIVIWLAALAFLLALLKITIHHIKRISSGNRNSIYSAAFILMMLISFSATLFLGSPNSEFILRYIQIPAETAFLAILSFSMIFSLFRWIRRKPDFYNLTFVFVVVFSLLANIGFLGIQFLQSVSLFNPFRWAMAGMRGILIGVALGSIVLGVRVLLGLDRPYGK